MKKTHQVETELPGKNEPLWIERMDACFTDEFRYQLGETIIGSIWSEIRHGEWSDPIEFFEYFDKHIEMVYDYKEKPSQLRHYFDVVNPGLRPVKQGGLADVVALDNLPVLRQQIFLLNALSIVIRKRLETDESLLIVSSMLTKLLHGKISDVLRNNGTISSNPYWDTIAKRVDGRATVADKANEIVVFLGEIIDKHDLRHSGDTRDTLLFMREQLEIPYYVIAQNNNRILNAFGEDKKLQGLCETLYWEFFRLIALTRLENCAHREEPKSDQDEFLKVAFRNVEPRTEKQVFLAMEFLLRTLGTTGNHTAQGKLMSFLSGYSSEEMRKKFSDHGKWEDRIENLKSVRDVFARAKMNKSVMRKLNDEIDEINKHR